MKPGPRSFQRHGLEPDSIPLNYIVLDYEREQGEREKRDEERERDCLIFFFFFWMYPSPSKVFVV